MTFGSLRTSAGRPAAITRPWSAHTRRSTRARQKCEVVFHHQHGHARVGDGADAAREVQLLHFIEAGCRFVEQQQKRVGSKRARDLHSAARSIGKLAASRRRVLGNAERLRSRHAGRLAESKPSSLIIAVSDRQTPTFSLTARPRAMLLQSRHFVDQMNVLERPRHAEARDAEWSDIRDVLVAKLDNAPDLRCTVQI